MDFINDHRTIRKCGNQAQALVVVFDETKKLIHGCAEVAAGPQTKREKTILVFVQLVVVLFGSGFARIATHRFKLVARCAVNQCAFRFRRPADVITKAFGCRASGWVEKHNLANLVFPRLSFRPFPGRDRLTGSTSGQQQDTRTLFRRFLLEWT